MKVAVFTGIGKIELHTYETPTIEDDKILVHIEACGICTWEQRIYSGKIDPAFPLLAGHEVAGKIESIGKHVKGDWHIGQSVVVGVTQPCRTCYLCKTHNEQNCQSYEKLRTLPGLPHPGTGGFSEYMMVIPSCIFPYEKVTPQQACICEPLACVVHSVETVNPQLGDTCVIIGAGIMGLLHTQLCVKRGTIVIVVDMNEERLKLASSMGAHETINPEKEDVLKKIISLTKGRKAQVVFDTTPMASMVEESCQYLGNTGKLMIYSGIYPNQPVSINAHWIHKEGIQILGSANANDSDFMRAITLIDKGIIDVAPFISGVYPIEHVKDALEESCKGTSFRNIVTFNERKEI